MATKKKAVKTTRIGRPPGTGKGLDILLVCRCTPALAETLDEEAAALGTDRSAIIRAWLEETAARKAQEKLAALLASKAGALATNAEAKRKKVPKPGRTTR
jgi:hypothetical protein